MMRRRHLIAGILASSAAFGVSLKDSTAQTRGVRPGKALVYVYREASIYGSGNSYDLYSNDHNVARMTNGGYFQFEVDPGQVSLRVHEVVWPLGLLTHALNNLSLDARPLYTFHAQASQTYYVKFNLASPTLQLAQSAKTRPSLPCRE
jgi:hypothetical protein